MSIFSLVGFGSGWFVDSYFVDLKSSLQVQQVRKQGNFRFISPLYECEVGGENFLKKYVPFEDVIKEKIANEVESSASIQLSVYFRNLNNGPWFGINEENNFAPASLLKVPLMIAYFKKSENDPNLFGSVLKFRKEAEANLTAMQQIQPTVHLEEGENYSIEELIRRMIVYSDNEAMALLFNNLPKSDLYQTYVDLGVKNPFENSGENVLTVKDYASFYRILYNAAYLDKNYSEKALALLAESDFDDGLVAGVPSSVKVAHKFGERELDSGDYRNQFHDCGIVYYAKYPYLLCVMTRGDNKRELIDGIKKVSQIVFEEVSRSYP